MGKIMTPERVRPYAGRRLTSIDADPYMLTPGQLQKGVFVYPKDVERIELHVGSLPSMLRRELRERDVAFKQVIQYNPREPVYFCDRNRTLHIPVWSGELRGNRYVEMINAYQEASKHSFQFEVVDIEGDHEKTLRNYRRFADGFVSHLSRSVDFDNIDSIVFGPLWAMAGASGPDAAIKALGSEYLSAQTLKLGKEVLNIGPCYSDQAKKLLEEILERYAGQAVNRGIKRELSIYMFGTMGGLLPGMSINDTLYPTGIYNDVDLQERPNAGFESLHPINNILAVEGKPSIILNVSSVMNETEEQLKRARKNGCSAVEMEAYLSVATIDMARIMYPDNLRLRFGLGGFFSDLPLAGETLAQEHSVTQGGLDVAKRIIDHSLSG
jgi:hypothetical protein